MAGFGKHFGLNWHGDVPFEEQRKGNLTELLVRQSVHQENSRRCVKGTGQQSEDHTGVLRERVGQLEARDEHKRTTDGQGDVPQQVLIKCQGIDEEVEVISQRERGKEQEKRTDKPTDSWPIVVQDIPNNQGSGVSGDSGDGEHLVQFQILFDTNIQPATGLGVTQFMVHSFADQDRFQSGKPKHNPGGEKTPNNGTGTLEETYCRTGLRHGLKFISWGD
ncbi:hypothetical protein WICPIJ_002191 [Wickerhamomyces pijperi]|uniref:Uncharacterized protein n=1 Tax=Wickerhamomyces pijperi TaxID=599730 RepID=A0A9P8TQ34_WICPI|nr:hypothetical protein WICPIJ_002191 [Wickerhamomyces pijperi]